MARMTKERLDDLEGITAKTAEEKELIAEIRAAWSENTCDACGGEGIPLSKLPCMCKGTGKMSEAIYTLRPDYFTLRARVEKLEELVQHTARAHTSDEAWEASERCYDFLDLERRSMKNKE